MRPTREHGIWAIAAAVLLAGGIWFARHTEWADEEVRDPPSPELRRDPELRLKRLLGRLGVKVTAPTNLEELPPPGATLLLISWHWNLFTEREAALRRWVEAGGQLVVPNFGVKRGGFDWVPIAARREPNEKDAQNDEDDDAAAAKPPPRPRPGAAPSMPRCAGVDEPAGVAPAFGFARGYATCMFLGGALNAGVAPSWALAGPYGQVIVRVPVGRGSVTASGSNLPFDNGDLLDHDNALIAVAALQVRPGREVWIVRDEARAPLLVFLWQRGAPAVLLGAAALAFALWRGARRFGPRIAALPLARRSMAEQVRGTAGFIAQHRSPALHAAQLRALTEAAAPRIRGFDAMTLGERAAAVAALAGMDANTLAHAMNPAPNPSTRAPPARHRAAALALLETARRRLLNAARPPASLPESR